MTTSRSSTPRSKGSSPGRSTPPRIQRDVGVTGGHGVHAVGKTLDDELDVQVRMKFAHVCDGVQRLSGEAHVSGDPDPGSWVACDGVGHRFEAEDLLRDGHESRSCRGKANGSGRAFEECRAKLLLQSGDLMADRRLRDEAALGSATEAQFLAHDEEVLELAEVHEDSLLMRQSR